MMAFRPGRRHTHLTVLPPGEPDLFAPSEPVPTFKGATFDREHDQARLETALGKIRAALLTGGQYTLAELAQIGGCSESGASARVRDCRRIYGMAIVSERVAGGLWVYQMVKP